LKAAQKSSCGVGQFGEGIRRLREGDWIAALKSARERGVWILGICLGMQLLTQSSEESECDGLGWFDFKTKRLLDQTESGDRRRIPHMGWNLAEFQGEANGVLADPGRYYFVHSYCVTNVDDARCWAITEYEGLRFASAIRDERVMGVQFHPEKSHRYGKTLLRHFMELADQA
jgi:glutamine amidotransferase